MTDDEFYETSREAEAMRDDICELRNALRAALDYIDAIPSDVVSHLPAVSGFARDDVEELLERTK